MRNKHLAKTLSHEAIERGWNNSALKFRDNAFQAIVVLAETEDEFTTDDIWEYFSDNKLELNHDGRALGGAMKRAESMGLIAPTDRFVSSERPACHARPVRIWTSQLTGDK